MRLTTTLTLDGLVRALRWQAHALADDAEQRYRRAGAGDDREPARPGTRDMFREHDDDRPRR